MRRLILLSVVVIGVILYFLVINKNANESNHELQPEDGVVLDPQSDENSLKNDDPEKKISHQPTLAIEDQEQVKMDKELSAVNKPINDDQSLDVSSSPEPGSQQSDSDLQAERIRLIRIAYDQARQGMEIPDSSTAIVEYESNIAIITFPFPTSASSEERLPIPGPEYIARVKIDRNTGSVIEHLVAP